MHHLVRRIGWISFSFLALGFAGLACSGSSSKVGSGGQATDAPTTAPAVATLSVPLGGNAFLTHAGPNATEVIGDGGLGNWTDPQSIISVYFSPRQAGQLQVSLVGSLNGSSSSSVRVSINSQPFTVTLKGASSKAYSVGTVTTPAAGYVKVDLQGLSKSGGYFGDISALRVSGTATASGVDCANDKANYYWSRRGPSVHLSYTVPAQTQYFYSELTVPAGQDPIGSYFMTNGFAQGYFGIQVNSATERRVLFSVWDPPAGGMSTLVAKGPGVVDNRFGGEGTGGQSYLDYAWVAGNTYKFITKATPVGSGTQFSAWFYAPELGTWSFIATWNSPNTTTYLSGCYAFVENFEVENGYLGRKAAFTNPWALSTSGAWTELTSAYFDGDDTANKNQRLDYAGGLENGQFFLRNGGFFSPNVPLNQTFTRPATGRIPAVDVTHLP